LGSDFRRSSIVEANKALDEVLVLWYIVVQTDRPDRQKGRQIMIVKVEGSNLKIKKIIDCNVATILPDGAESSGNRLICEFDDYEDEFLLSEGDKVFFMNNQGKTIDSDYRMVPVRVAPE
jgi:hypothetical protein